MNHAGWRERLREAVERDPRSLREISVSAGLGPNYLSQTLRGKDPQVGPLGKILDVLGSVSLIYVLTGFDFGETDAAFAGLVLTADPEDLERIAGLLRSRETQESQALPSDPSVIDMPSEKEPQ